MSSFTSFIYWKKQGLPGAFPLDPARGLRPPGPPAVFFLKIMNLFFLKYITKTILGTLLSNITGIDNIRIKRLGETQGDQDKLTVTKI